MSKNETGQLNLFDDGLCVRQCPQLPEEFKGQMRTPCGYTDTLPRAWTQKEEDFIYCLKKDGWSVDEIAKSVGRSKTSVAVKLKRIQKHPEENCYNSGHVEEKYSANKKFIDQINSVNGDRVTSLLDVYCGVKSWWRNEFSKSYDEELKTVTNDKDEKIEADFHMEAKRFCYKMAAEGKKFDIVDLDPFGSAFDCLVPTFEIAKKGIIITLGEMGHRRWKRIDMVRRAYRIETIEDFTTDNVVKEIQRIAKSYKVNLIVDSVYEWNRISRVYFRIGERERCTEQWHGKFDKE